jgi:predicted transposase YbfD/YdcC
MKFIKIIFLILFLALPFSLFAIEISIQYLEGYLGKPVPANAKRVDINQWTIELENTRDYAQFVILETKNNIVTIAAYHFVSSNYRIIQHIRVTIFNLTDNLNSMANDTLIANCLVWEIEPVGEIKNNLYLILSDIRNNQAGYYFNFEVLMR